MSKKQATVSCSYIEAKYHAMANVTCEIICLFSLLKDFNVSHLGQAIMFYDNQAALHIATNPVFHEHTKHIRIEFHLVREKVQHDIFNTSYVSS